MRELLALIRKDLVLEWRRKETLIAVFFFAVVVLVLFYIAFPPGSLTMSQRQALNPGILWIALSFAGVISVMRAFDRERAARTLDGLLLTPIPASYLYLSKLITGSAFLLLIELFVFPLFVIIFNVPLDGRVVLMVIPLVFGTIGYLAVGILFSAVTARVQVREMLMPLLIFPITFPVLIASVEVTKTLLGAWKTGVFFNVSAFLIGADIFYLLVGYFLFPFAVRD